MYMLKQPRHSWRGCFVHTCKRLLLYLVRAARCISATVHAVGADAGTGTAGGRACSANPYYYRQAGSTEERVTAGGRREGCAGKIHGGVAVNVTRWNRTGRFRRAVGCGVAVVTTVGQVTHAAVYAGGKAGTGAVVGGVAGRYVTEYAQVGGRCGCGVAVGKDLTTQGGVVRTGQWLAVYAG